MKTVVCKKYGPPEVLQIVDRPIPTPRDNEVCIKNYATAVTAWDSRIRGCRAPRWLHFLFKLAMWIFGPRKEVLGMQFAWVIETVGKEVSEFKVGDEVFGSTNTRQWTYAQYFCVPTKEAIIHKPKELSWTDAAALPFGWATAIWFLEKFTTLEAWDRILINGASGCVGTYMIQVAKTHGVHVTAVCSGKNKEIVMSLWADEHVDYTTQDITALDQTYDYIYDFVGNLWYKDIKHLLTQKWVLHIWIGSMRQLFFQGIGNKKVKTWDVSKNDKETLWRIVDLWKAWELKPVIDSIYPLEDIVKAHARVDTIRKVGNVVVSIDHNQ